MDIKQFDIDFAKGKEIFEQQSLLGFSGELEMSFPRLCGYIHAQGQWNNFYPEKITPVLRQLDQSAPKMDYGPNNPNTGHIQHKWSIHNDTIFLSTNSIHESEFPKWQNWFNQYKPLIESKILADEINLNFFHHQGYFGNRAKIQLRIWWD